METPQIHRPIPRRTFELTPVSTDSTPPASPTPDYNNSELLVDRRQDSSLPSRTRSILNLTSSTLLGIYSPTGHDGSREELSTPWGTGAQTPSHRRSLDGYRPQEAPLSWNGQSTAPKLNVQPKRVGIRGYWIPLALQTALLFGSGVAYGSIVTQLQKRQRIAPVPMPAVKENSPYYHILWGLLGVLLGNALPLVDGLLEDSESPSKSGRLDINNGSAITGSRDTDGIDYRRSSSADPGLGPFWYSAVRSIGVFVGIAFAVRRIPWQSTLQVSLTLALVNPVLWYLIDRSMPGFALSSIIGIVGAFILLVVNPNFVPVPAIHQVAASEQIGVYTWLMSILFCTSLCFGAIGRRLHL